MITKHDGLIMVQPKINLKKIWEDNDLLMLEISVSEGDSLFINNVYTTEAELKTIVEKLTAFRGGIYGGICNICLGEFGPEVANGAFHARLHFKPPGILYVSTHQQTDFKQFSINQVANEAKFYLNSEPVLLDNFVLELEKLRLGNRDEALLKCVTGN